MMVADSAARRFFTEEKIEFTFNSMTEILSFFYSKIIASSSYRFRLFFSLDLNDESHIKSSNNVNNV